MKKLKIILINILLGTIPILLIAALIYSYTRNDIIEVTNQTHIIEPLTVIKTDIKASNLKSNHRTFTESDIYGELIMRYQLSNGETYQDKFNLRQIHNHQLPDNESVLTKTYYKGTYVLKNGKTVTLETHNKLKKGSNIHRSQNPQYQWTHIKPHTEPINTTIYISYTVPAGKILVRRHYDEPYTVTP